MPRTRAHTKDSLASAALDVFWQHGFTATSLDQLVKATGASRHGIYAEFGNKQALFAAVFEIYQREVVSPAFAPVEDAEANISAIGHYFENQIAYADSLGLPGRGCLVANTIAEGSSHTKAVKQCVAKHNARFREGFARALINTRPTLSEPTVLADTVVTFSHGLWAMSRIAEDATTLRRTVAQFMTMLKHQIDQGESV